jgi:hypothetical protein
MFGAGLLSGTKVFCLFPEVIDYYQYPHWGTAINSGAVDWDSIAGYCRWFFLSYLCGR